MNTKMVGDLLRYPKTSRNESKIDCLTSIEIEYFENKMETKIAPIKIDFCKKNSGRVLGEKKNIT